MWSGPRRSGGHRGRGYVYARRTTGVSDRSPPPATGDRLPYSSLGPEALMRLGLNVYAPLRSVQPTLQRLLPEAATGGYFAALRDAVGRGEVAAGSGSDQLRWLADHLRLSAPRED